MTFVVRDFSCTLTVSCLDDSSHVEGAENARDSTRRVAQEPFRWNGS
jgi:hypothetical protein